MQMKRKCLFEEGVNCLPCSVWVCEVIAEGVCRPWAPAQNYDIYVPSSTINTRRRANDASFPEFQRERLGGRVSEGTSRRARLVTADICTAVNSVWPVAVSEHVRVRFTSWWTEWDDKHAAGRMWGCWVITGAFDGVHLPPGVWHTPSSDPFIHSPVEKVNVLRFCRPVGSWECFICLFIYLFF